MTHLPHPEFGILHAHFLEASELVAAGVSASSMVALYPVEASAYESFVRRFYVENPIPSRRPKHLIESYATISGCMALIEDKIVNTYSSEEWGWYFDFVDGDLPPVLDSLIPDIIALDVDANAAFGGQLRYQISILMRSMRLLSSWSSDSIVDTDQTIITQFFNGFAEMAAFFKVDEAAVKRLREAVAS